jgi:drug/metabolite transporter (DMT)-like permease
VKQKLPTTAIAALVAVTIIWGAAFVIMKPAIEQEPFWDFLAFRFTIATLAMIALKPKVLLAFTPKLLIRGSILGALLGASYITQTIALELTSAAITGFLTGLYVVATPILTWILFKQKTRKRVWFGSFLALIGLGVISITGGGIELAQIWGVACAIIFAGHIVLLGRWSPGLDSYALTVVQLGFIAVVMWIGSAPDGIQPPPNLDVWMAVLFTAVLATAFAFFMQTWAQARMEASRVAVIMTLEVVFTAVIAVLVGQEVLTLKTVIGGALIVVAMFIVEWPAKDGLPDPVAVDPMVH